MPPNRALVLPLHDTVGTPVVRFLLYVSAGDYDEKSLYGVMEHIVKEFHDKWEALAMASPVLHKPTTTHYSKSYPLLLVVQICTALLISDHCISSL
jgi:hypothetical protein